MTESSFAITDISNFFSACEARDGRWAKLATIARHCANSREALQDQDLRDLQGRLAELQILEGFWAYPGQQLLNQFQGFLDKKEFASFATLSGRIATALLSGAFRHDVSVWDANDTSDISVSDFLPNSLDGAEQHRPHFEVLSVTPLDPSSWSELISEVHRLRRAEDRFHYDLVPVSSFVDAIAAVLCNRNLQAVILNSSMIIQSRHAIPLLLQHIESAAHIDLETLSGSRLAILLANILKKIRPEIDIYLNTSLDVEKIAGSPDAQVFRRIFFGAEEVMELHLSILDGVNDRYETAYFFNLKKYSQRPIGTFHALPIARGKSVFRSQWIRDMAQFYGTSIFLAESSATTGGLDSLLEPTGNIKIAQQMAARAFGADRAYFVTNGTSTSNKIVLQAVLAPGDIVLIDRNCHKSHHYAMVLSGAQPLYLDAYALTPYSMYGAVPLRSIKQALLQLKAEGKLDRAKLVDLTNCTFDGHMYNPRRVMEECLAIKPDLIFLWDEAWFGFARFSFFHRRRTGMNAAAVLTERYASENYRKEYEAFRGQVGDDLDPADSRLLDMHLLPDPDKVRIRVYQTHSTHKSMSALRQGSMVLVHDQDFNRVESAFEEAYFTHSSTSPNLQIIASLDLARRQMELEGFALTMKATELALDIRRQVAANPLVSKYFRILTNAELVPAEYRASGLEDYGVGHSNWKEVLDAWNDDEFALDPTRLTLICGSAGFDGTEFKGILADRYDIQLNKTTRNSILLQTNINNTRSDVAHLIKVLADIARQIETDLARGNDMEKNLFAERVKSLVEDVPDLPNFSAFHDFYRDDPASKTAEGHMREAFYAAYDPANCEYVKVNSAEMDERLKNGPVLVAADFVIPYPPGFPIMVPGQIVTTETIAFMRKLDVKEIHGYHAAQGLRLLKMSALKKSQGK